MKFLGALRLLVLGETWVLPLGVFAVLLAGAAASAAFPELWRDAGGFVLLSAVLAVLAVSVARGSGKR